MYRIYQLLCTITSLKCEERIDFLRLYRYGIVAEDFDEFVEKYGA